MFPKLKTILGSTIFLSILFLLSTLIGCSASTNFKPPCDHKVYLGMENGGFTLIKDSVVDYISEKPDTFLECSSLAQATLVKSAKSFSSGQSLLMGGAVFNIFFSYPVGIVFTLNGQAKLHTGMAQMIDAMNIHNDQSECLFPTDRKEEQIFETKQGTEELIIPKSVEILYNSTTTILNRQLRIICVKKRESLFFSSITLSFEGIIGVDKNQDGSFQQTSLKVEKNDKFYIRTMTLLLHVEVVRETDSGVALTFQTIER